jgi:pyruvate,orthophosphate dikinase
LDQLKLAVRSVYAAWFAQDMIKLRTDIFDLPSRIGIAICIQEMMFGSTGSCFSRNPITGENTLFGEYFCSKAGVKQSFDELDIRNPALVSEIRAIVKRLEVYYRRVQVMMII